MYFTVSNLPAQRFIHCLIVSLQPEIDTELLVVCVDDGTNLMNFMFSWRPPIWISIIYFVTFFGKKSDDDDASSGN